MKFHTFRRALAFVCLLIFSIVLPANAQKLAPEEIVAKHLDSIGAKDKRSLIKNQIIFQNVEYKQKGSTAVLNGRGLIASAGEKSLWGMTFNSNEYSKDNFGFNGKDAKVGFIKPGARSILGDFIYTYRELLKEGLLGGTLTSSWALANSDPKKHRISADGTKTINGVDCYVLSFMSKNGMDLSVKMYFDKQTFQHLRTEYNRVISARQGATVDGSAGQGEDRYRLIEDFSDYMKMGDLNLPSRYKISYSYSSSATTRLAQKANREAEWTFNVTNFSFNQQLDDTSFEIDTQ